MTPEERLTSAISTARRIAPADDVAQRLAGKVTALGPPSHFPKLPLLVKVGIPIAIVAAALVGWRGVKHVDAPSPPPTTTIVVTTPAVMVPPVATTTPDNTVSVDDLPSVKAPAVRATQLKSDPNAELALVSRAESTLPSDPAGALALTEEHRSKYPSGQLVIEREVIAVEALAKLGRKTDAKQRSDQFLAQHPDSPYRVRLERALR